MIRFTVLISLAMSKKKCRVIQEIKSERVPAIRFFDSFFYQVPFRIVREMKYRNFSGIFTQLPCLVHSRLIHTGKPTTAPAPAQQKRDKRVFSRTGNHDDYKSAIPGQEYGLRSFPLAEVLWLFPGDRTVRGEPDEMQVVICLGK